MHNTAALRIGSSSFRLFLRVLGPRFTGETWDLFQITEPLFACLRHSLSAPRARRAHCTLRHWQQAAAPPGGGPPAPCQWQGSTAHCVPGGARRGPWVPVRGGGAGGPGPAREGEGAPHR